MDHLRNRLLSGPADVSGGSPPLLRQPGRGAVSSRSTPNLPRQLPARRVADGVRHRDVSRNRWIRKLARIDTDVSTHPRPPRPVVHLELHTCDQVRAGTFYGELLNWKPQWVRAASSSYLTVDVGCAIGGGIVECATRRPLWLPYVEVDRVDTATEDARRLGATVILEPCEGPSGWRSVVSSPVAGELALWELKR